MSKQNFFYQPEGPLYGSFGFSCLLMGSMVTSPFLLSISMWGLVAMALWHVAQVIKRSGERISIGKILLRSFDRYFRRPELWLAGLLLLVAALSGLWSENEMYWLERTRVRIPFFVMPWAFANLPQFSPRQHRLLLYMLVVYMAALSIGVGVHYFTHRVEILEGLGHGRPIPVPRNHIRFNLTLATAIIAGAWLWAQRFTLRYRWERPVLGAIVVFLFAVIHLLSVRSGLAALYAVIFFSICRFLILTRRWREGILAFLVMLITPAVALLTLPSLQQRVNYMVWDWKQYEKNAGDNYSDSERWISMQVGLDLWREHPWLGVGMGDLPEETQTVTSSLFPRYSYDPRLPHNQFIYTLAGTGIVGFLVLMVALLYPVAVGRWRKHYLYAAFQVIIFISFLVEYTLETSIGAAFYLFYWLWLMRIAEEVYES